MAKGIPLKGDRSAHDVNNYPALHASDLEASIPKHHVPVGLASGDVPVWDGSKWALGTSPVNMNVLTSDPSSPVEGQSWVLVTNTGQGGSPIGLLLSITSPGTTYQLTVFVDGAPRRVTLI